MVKLDLKGKSVNTAKLIEYGFKMQNGRYIYTASLPTSGFLMTATVSSGELLAQVTDPDTGDEYTLHLSPSAAGSFVGAVREEYESILNSIYESCLDADVFKKSITKEILAYALKKYGDEPEYLWAKTPDNAILRRKDCGKWYAAVLTVGLDKLGFDSTERAEIIDLRINPAEMAQTVDNRRYFPGYHMNKKHWYTIILDGSVPADEICRRIDESYILAKK